MKVSGTTKVADAGGYKSVLKSLFSSPSFVAALGAPVVAGGVHFAAKKLKAKEDATARAVAYKDMLELNPTLRQRDQKRVAQIYSSLGNVNPILARDPLVAGAFVNNIMENTSQLGDEVGNQALLGAVKDMAGIGAHISAARKNNNPNQAFEMTNQIIQNLGGGIEKGLGRNYADLDKRYKGINKEVNETVDKELESKFPGVAQAHQAEQTKLKAQSAEIQTWIQEVHAREQALNAREAGKHAAAETTELETFFAALGI